MKAIGDQRNDIMVTDESLMGLEDKGLELEDDFKLL